MLKKVLFLLVVWIIFAIAIPMESLNEYNLVLVHGAGSHWGGLDCENGDVKHEKYNLDSVGYASAWTYYDFDSGTRIGGIEDKSPATGMIKELKPWIQDTLFEGSYDTLIYLQRPFTNPANSPSNNGNEIGKRTWKGSNKCSARRSLFEEIQEVHAKGQNSLNRYRNDSLDSYRKIPSRYILVSHSMGGVASREYVQGTNYNYDVDKVITLDSPHEGTGTLNLLLQLKDVDLEERFKNSMTQFMAIEAFTIATYLMGFGELSSSLAVLGIALPLASNISHSLFGAAIAAILGDDFDYSRSDSLTSYIDPHSGSTDNVIKLKTKGYFENQPMFRLLYGVDGMTFSDPKRRTGVSLGGVVPQNIGVPIGNAYNNLKDGGSGAERFYNTIASAVYGVLAGITIEDHGTALIPSHSGKGEKTAIFNDPRTDIRKESYNGNIMLNSTPSDFSDEKGLFELSFLPSPGSIENVSAITGEILTITAGFVLAAAAVDYALQWNQPGRFAAKTALVAGVSAAIVNLGIVNITIGGFGDLNYSHRVPIKSHFQKKWKADSNSYTSLSLNRTVSSTPYLMEDFLYERPFVNLALSLSDSALRSVDSGCYYEVDDANKQQLCEVGLYGSRDSIVVDTLVVKDTTGTGKDSVRYDTTHIYNAVAERLDSIGNVVRDSSGKVVYDSVYYGTFEQQKYSDFRNSPLKFKSESDWYKVGVKVDRWERVDGLKPNGDPAPKGVPIRHVERYNVPDIVVDGFIEKYSFVVDDLMPHRMRQIKMTFNSNEEVAWECNIKAAEDDPHACAVYKRLLGNSWGSPDTTIGDKGYVPHPIKKNGRFDFNARKYFGNLANIQKDNQNTVVISMVNKIGLSNTQRFYYLFKATDNMLKPTWPQHDVVLNAIDGFKAYVSALDYQGFRVHGANDEFFRDSLDNYVVRFGSLVMDTAIAIGNNGSEYVFASKRKDLNPAEGEYRWVVSANISNKELKSPSEPDSSKTDSYEVHFKVDRTAPAFVLTSDAMMNPDSSMFITRFKWAGKDSADKANGSDIRAMLA